MPTPTVMPWWLVTILSLAFVFVDVDAVFLRIDKPRPARPPNRAQPSARKPVGPAVPHQAERHAELRIACPASIDCPGLSRLGGRLCRTLGFSPGEISQGNVKMTLLNEFMTAESLPAAVNNLATPICRQLDLPDVYQLGLVVPDAVAADEAMVRDWGLDPSLMIDGEAALWIENGKELDIGARLGLTYHQGYELELIEPRKGADFYARDLNPDGEIFLHHFGFLVHDLDLQTARLTSQGVPLLVRGRIHSGPLTADFSYLDTRGAFGLITELICMQFLGIHTRIPPPLARFVGRHQMRSGKRVLSL